MVAAALVLGVAPAVAEIPFVRRRMPCPALCVDGAVAVCAWFGLAALFAALLFWFVHPTASEAEILARLGVIAVSLLPATALAVSALIVLSTRGKLWNNAVRTGVSTITPTSLSGVALRIVGTAATGPS